jgi:hypothetical protein
MMANEKRKRKRKNSKKIRHHYEVKPTPEFLFLVSSLFITTVKHATLT